MKEKKIKEFWIYEINNNYTELADSKIVILTKGRVKNFRLEKNFVFLEINDGTSKNLHIVISKENVCFDFKNINLDSYIWVTGFIKIVERIQKYELFVISIANFSKNQYKNYPLQNKKINLNLIRKLDNFKSRTRYYSNIFYLRSIITKLINDFFYYEHFHKVVTPIITNLDTEGAGETFQIFSQNKIEENKDVVKLTVSGQLHIEILAQSMGKVFNFSPCFRAEKSNTTRHLAEFWMLEAEFITSDIQELIFICQKMIKYLVDNLLKEEIERLKFLEDYQNILLIERLTLLSNIENFVQIDYLEALEILSNNNMISERENNNDYAISYTQERFLCDFFKKPVFVLRYPKIIKPFYMKESGFAENKVECFDLLLPGVGEVIGGSLREDCYKTLKKKIEESNLDKMDWYLNLRASGYAPTGGFGVGFERILMFLLGVSNIQDVIQFPILYSELF